MVCPQCNGVVDAGRCARCGWATAAAAKPGAPCPKCKALATPGEKFCAACGAEIRSRAQIAGDRREREEIDQKIGRARKWLLAVSILTLLSGFVFYGLQKSQVEKQIAEAERNLAELTPKERDELLVSKIGMTWDQVVNQDRGQVRLLLWVNMGLAVIYFVLFLWAKSNAFAASLIALILFVTVIVISAILEPKSLMQGWILKPLFILALLSAVSSAYKGRKLYGARA